ncbi:putative MFS transporter [Rosellinia necatrix]|uniref:Putative MFS transporter n=1 Tax=Rosellinia necatrix TaxID=77044 RepID=A0A1W2TLG4_ROSNE|nr:putative MFS transporter [Rosellinia necatrix]
MSITQTAVADITQSYPLAELTEPHREPVKDLESSSEQQSSRNEATDREPATPFLKLVVAGYSFFCAGINDGTLGPLIPYILSSFHIGTGEIAIIYGTTFAGWLLAAVTNPILTAQLTLGQLLFIGSLLQLVAQALRPWSPLAVFCVSFLFQALGMAYQDAHSNTFVSDLNNVPHRWLSFIHACYALGTFIGPLIATAIANSADSLAIDGWKRVYFVLIGVSVLNVAGVMIAFRDTLYKRLNAGSESRSQKRNQRALVAMTKLLKSKTLWLLSMFYFFHLGATFTAGGWVVEFLTTVRGGKLSSVGYIPTGFYGGLLAGRLLLPEPTFRFGEQRTILVYSAICAALQLVFWLQPSIVGSAIALSFIGFFSGPFFATGMSVASKLFPRESQPAALGFIFVLAQAGGAIFPSITGLIATSAGVAVLQPIVLALFVVGGITWWLVPKIPHRDE